MAPKKKKKAENRAMQVRVSPEEYAKFQQAAARDGRSLSGWVRHRLAAAASEELS